jgi:hypothetical protein
MAFPSRDEVRDSCSHAIGLGYSVEPGVTVAVGSCCPLGAVLIARGLGAGWDEGTSDWLDLARLLGCDADEVEAFTNAFDGVSGARHPVGTEMREGWERPQLPAPLPGR